MPFQFTRYLYVKEEVELCLLISLLKGSDDALFWAYELYYSGFLLDFRHLILKIYFYFYAPLNIPLCKYLINQLNQMKKCPECVAKIVLNLQNRNYLLDVFLLETQVKLFEIEDDYNLDIWNESLAKHLLQYEDVDFILNYYKVKAEYESIISYYNKSPKTVLLSLVCHFFCDKMGRPMGRNSYVKLPDNLDTFETIILEKKYRVLPLAYKYEIDPHNWLNLFQLAREKNGLRGIYFYHWSYFCLQTPFWREKIHNFEIDETRKQLWFPEDSGLEYNLEPDEQTAETQNKVLKQISREKTWKDFVREFGFYNIYEIDEEYLEEFGKLNFF